VRRPDRRPGGDLPAGRARRADRQRPERVHPDRAGVRGRDRLRAGADRPLPCGAALRGPPARHQAVAVALGRAAPAIIASGATVILSLLCLLVAELASTKSLGPVMAVGVAVGLCAMLPLLPALLVIFGRWVFWPRRPTLGSAEPTEHGLWARIGQRMAPRPRLVWVVTAVVLGALALGVTQLDANGLQSKDSFRTKPEA